MQVYTDDDNDIYTDTSDEWDNDDRVGIRIAPEKIVVEKREETADETV